MVVDVLVKDVRRVVRAADGGVRVTLDLDGDGGDALADALIDVTPVRAVQTIINRVDSGGGW